jgi:hypothetical protein
MSVEYIDSETGLQVLAKQPSETRKFWLDFSNKLHNSTISGVSSVTVAGLGRVAGASAVTVSGTAFDDDSVSFLLAGGTSGEMYHVTVVVTLSTGETSEADGALLVMAE